MFYHNGCEALSRVSLIKSICLQRREFDLIKIIRNILDKYHPRSPFDLTEINGGGFNHASADATLESTTICYVAMTYTTLRFQVIIVFQLIVSVKNFVCYPIV